MKPRARLERRPVPNLDRHWCFAIVRACRGLSPGSKLLYGLLLELDRPERDGVGGAFAGELELARQLGAGIDHVSDLRTHFDRLGLVHRAVVPGSRVSYWFPTLPPEVETSPPRGTSREDRGRWLLLQAETLDRHIDERERAITSPVIRGRERHAPDRRNPPSSDETQRRNPPLSTGGIRRQATVDDGGETGPSRRNPPSPEHEDDAIAARTETVKQTVSETETVLHTAPPPDSVNARTRAEGQPPPPNPELAAIVEKHRRKAAEAVARKAQGGGP